MFGNRYVNYGGPGGVRRGLIWQSSTVGGVDPCEVSKDWPEWTNPGFFNLEEAAKLAFKSLTYDKYKDAVEADTGGEMTEAYYNSMKDSELEVCLQHIRDHIDQNEYNGMGIAGVHFYWWKPLLTWGYRFLWYVVATKQHDIKGYYSTLYGSKVNNEYWKTMLIKGDPNNEHNYMYQSVEAQWIIGYPPYVWETYYDDSDPDAGRAIGSYMTGYQGQNRLAQVRYETQIPNCVVSPCATSHWLGNNVDIHH